MSLSATMLPAGNPGDRGLSADAYDALPPFRTLREHPLPTLLRAGPYRLFVFMADCQERPHVHVDGNEGEAKFWLAPVSLADNVGYSPREIHRIRGIVTSQRSLLTDAFNEICEQARR
jgi:hypothetical protein